MLSSFILAELTQADLQKIANPVIEVCQILVPVLLGVVGAIGMIWCILLGVKYAKAEDPQEHEKAKKALVNAVVGFVLIFVLLIMLQVGVNVFKEWYTGYDFS